MYPTIILCDGRGNHAKVKPVGTGSFGQALCEVTNMNDARITVRDYQAKELAAIEAARLQAEKAGTKSPNPIYLRASRRSKDGWSLMSWQDRLKLPAYRQYLDPSPPLQYQFAF